MLEAANLKLKSIRIESLEKDIYYAIASLGCNSQVKEIDARPSDAIALALINNSPIYVNEAVMKEAAMEAPPDVKNAPVGRGLSSFRNEYENKRQENKKKQQENQEKFRQLRKENIKAINDQTIEFLFGRD